MVFIGRVFIFGMLFMGAACSSAKEGEQQIVIRGVVKGVEEQKIFLHGAGAVQSADLANGSFEFKTHIPNPPALLRFELKKPDKNGLPYWILGDGPGPMLLADNRDNIAVTLAPNPDQEETQAAPGYVLLDLKTSFEATAIGREYLEFRKTAVQGGIDPAVDKVNEMVEVVLRGESLDGLGDADSDADEDAFLTQKLGPHRAKALQGIWGFSRSMHEIRQEYWMDYIRRNAGSVNALFALSHASGFSIGRIEEEDALSLFNGLHASIKSTALGSSMGRDITEGATKAEQRSTLATGTSFKDFTLRDVDGKPVKMSSLLKPGRYVFLDFWASWCGPCRQENPHVLEQYEKYHDKGFDVVAVSLDEGEKAWLKAIKEDAMPWIHLSDLKGLEGEVVKLYGVGPIPDNFLLDEKGNIVAQKLHGAALEKKLAEIFDGS